MKMNGIWLKFHWRQAILQTDDGCFTDAYMRHSAPMS